MTAGRHDDMDANDPTRSGPPLSAGKDVRLSQNEIQQLCLKAARGAGMSWGLAEEAGFAAVWLAMHGLDGPGALLGLLRDTAGRPWREICPHIAPGFFRPIEGGSLCPIALGATICDHATLPETAMDATSLRFGPVSHPVLLLPFLSDVVRLRGGSLRLDWPRGMVVVSANGRMSGDTGALAQEVTLEAELTVQADRLNESPAAVVSRLVSSEILRDLNIFALRTTVPPSDVSRAGAGATGGDND